ncbi:MAG: elongation factor Ts [Candidatus Sungbacteria bacterium RIFCSPLOWO2_02_FULL_51_17]|uniref:Elongation factor Ts n=1 Tax=Candidatus Sungbacteria bacterium RIFCSPHIGHO2_02_FULL_51_29 TaxID=1802273 RepID=A0A1G2KSN4_9BACT|nr:MAG: elongation factor Ts [Candidatus Sungbacteria bacterium RIFCSPHIGHO2_01_FULL_51_22]OHA01369.1 MAG: elongation factor Ts [Candidatus Sungbacteria bacterium RIFCSPHIGHO2_02_FULL_51_29]OHA07924.1 MAG: elongation factor Ts [Candidatus Sungbacteria bacterium RIFCSPLOWO2_01_FULL_51_34]OHA12259.1 MAG: elongation factor Ts [Candidatus Sungbacteria bacterium RIFCSPLOWO2_02_FULL_51_17]
MAVSAELIKKLRDKTGASINECKKALEECAGDMEKAMKALEKRLGGLAGKRTGRETKEGVIDSYIHSNGKIGVLLELFSETDFVARNSEFKALAHDLSMHIAAAAPTYVSSEDVPADIVQEQKQVFMAEVTAMNKPADIAATIVEGKLKGHFGAISLLSQPYVKDPSKTAGDVVREMIGKIGENIKVGRFARFEL